MHLSALITLSFLKYQNHIVQVQLVGDSRVNSRQHFRWVLRFRCVRWYFHSSLLHHCVPIYHLKAGSWNVKEAVRCAEADLHFKPLEDLPSLEEQVSAVHEFPLFQQQSNVIPIVN